jgi:hypothetical protein
MAFGWRLKNRDHDVWGDYSQFLVFGMLDTPARNARGELRLARTGPFVPPLWLPNLDSLVTTANGRRLFEASNLEGLTFRPVELGRIARVDWQAWDLGADEPARYPDSGEPEGYVLDAPHDTATADEIGPIWEVVLMPTDNAGEADLATDGHTVQANLSASRWVETTFGEWVATEFRVAR